MRTELKEEYAKLQSSKIPIPMSMRMEFIRAQEIIDDAIKELGRKDQTLIETQKKQFTKIARGIFDKNWDTYDDDRKYKVLKDLKLDLLLAEDAFPDLVELIKQAQQVVGAEILKLDQAKVHMIETAKQLYNTAPSARLTLRNLLKRDAKTAKAKYHKSMRMFSSTHSSDFQQALFGKSSINAMCSRATFVLGDLESEMLSSRNILEMKMLLSCVVKRVSQTLEKPIIRVVAGFVFYNSGSTESHQNTLIFTCKQQPESNTIDIDIKRYEPWGERGNPHAVTTFNTILQKMQTDAEYMVWMNDRLEELFGEKFTKAVFHPVQDLLISCPGPQTKYACEREYAKLWDDAGWGFCSAYSLFYIYMRLRPETDQYSDDELAKILVTPNNTAQVCYHFKGFIEKVMRIAERLEISDDIEYKREKLANKRRKQSKKKKKSAVPSTGRYVTRSVSKKKKASIQRKRKSTLGTITKKRVTKRRN
jgi:hypothetical protein